MENFLTSDITSTESFSIKPANHIVEIYSNNKPIVTINNDGSHTFHDLNKIDEAARQFWQAVSTYFTLMKDEDYDIVSKAELDSLRKDAFELQCLHDGGVDNWEWYSESLQEGGFFDEEIE